MSRNEIMAALRKILVFADSRYEAAAEQCTEETRLREDLGLDSASMLYLMIAMEETFGAIFDEASAGSFNTIGEIIDWIQRSVR